MAVGGERGWISAIGVALFATAAGGTDDTFEVGARA